MENFFYFIPDNYIFLILVIMFSGFIRGFLGFASGLITIPILSSLYSPIFAMVFNIVLEIASFYKISVAATHHHFPMLLLLGPIVLRRCCYNELIGKTLSGRQLMHGDLLLLLMQLH